MKNKIIIATHGRLAEGLLDSSKLIAGEIDNVETLCAYISPGIDYSKEVEYILKNNDYNKYNLIVLTDLLGGSINNEFMNRLGKYKFILVSGVNLPLVLELVLHKDILSADDIESIIRSCKRSMVCVNKLHSSMEQVDEDF